MTADPPTWGGQPVVVADLRTTNGYVHVLDGVALPDRLLRALED